MVWITFYEKRNCLANARQKAMLREAGHVLIVRDLLAEPWTAGRLRSFFGDVPVSHWFNRAAPRVKSGEVVPEGFGEAAALAAMLADPLLIRRPLIEVGDWRCAGFDAKEIDRVVGLLPGRSASPRPALEACGQTPGSCRLPVPVRMD